MGRRTGDPLVGKFFHSRGPAPLREIQWQGEFIARLGAERYLVQLFDWVVGADSDKRVVNVTEMDGWHIYDTDEEMRLAYERHQRRFEETT